MLGTGNSTYINPLNFRLSLNIYVSTLYFVTTFKVSVLYWCEIPLLINGETKIQKRLGDLSRAMQLFIIIMHLYSFFFLRRHLEIF